MKERIILIGGGGHCRSCIDVIEAEGHYEVAGIIDARLEVGALVSGYPVLGSDAGLRDALREHTHALVTVGQILSPDTRVRLYALAGSCNAVCPVIVSPHAYVSVNARLGAGTIVLHRGVVNAHASIGRNVIINTGAIIEHDATVGDHCHVSTGAVINGGCALGEGSFVGSGAIITEGVSIPARTVIAAGAVVKDTLPAGGIYAGVPARKIG